VDFLLLVARFIPLIAYPFHSIIIIIIMQGEEAIVKCGTTKGPIEMKFYRDWSPNGYDRATYLYEQVSVSFVEPFCLVTLPCMLFSYCLFVSFLCF
jgi:hypothetical protein